MENKRSIEKILKKVFHFFTKKEKKHHPGIFHCHKDKPLIRRKLLSLLGQKEISILAVYLDKRKVYTQMQNEKHVLYNYVANILLDRIYTKKLIPIENSIKLVASRRETNKFLNDNFQRYLEGQIHKNHKLPIKVLIKTPAEEKGLQLVDFACWAIFRKKEFGDESYYELIKEKIIEEDSLFPE